MIGLREVANKRAGDFSSGMGQRLGIAAALLLGDPKVLVLDEPVNGLDPEGIHWIRNLLKHLASEGRTVLVSSHLMNEMAVTADHLIVIGHGKLIADCPTAEFIGRSSHKSVRVRGPDRLRLEQAIRDGGGHVQTGADGALTVTDLAEERIGELVALAGLVLHELSPQLGSLEEAFMELTHDSVELGAQDSDAVLHPGTAPLEAGRR